MREIIDLGKKRINKQRVIVLIIAVFSEGVLVRSTVATHPALLCR